MTATRVRDASTRSAAQRGRQAALGDSSPQLARPRFAAPTTSFLDQDPQAGLAVLSCEKTLNHWLCDKIPQGWTSLKTLIGVLWSDPSLAWVT